MREQIDLTGAINETLKLWRKYHLNYDQTKYVVSKVRRKMEICEKRKKFSIVNRLSLEEAERLIAFAYDSQGRHGLLIKTLFLTGARVNEFVNIRVEDILFPANEILLTTCKGGKSRYVPILSTLSQEIKSYLNGRAAGYLFESNRNDRYTTRRIEQIVQKSAKEAGIVKRVYPHLLRHSVATILRQKGMQIDSVQKFLGHSHVQTTQIYSEAPDDEMKEVYRKALQSR